MQALLEVLTCPEKEPGVLVSKAPISTLVYAEITLDGTLILEKRICAACCWARWGGGQCAGRWPMCGRQSMYGEMVSVRGDGQCVGIRPMCGRRSMCGEAVNVWETVNECVGDGQCVGIWPMCGRRLVCGESEAVNVWGGSPCVGRHFLRIC